MRSFSISSAVVIATILLGVAATPRVTAREQPNAPAASGQDDRTNPPSGAGGPPSGEQNRSAAPDQGRDPRGNDRDLTTERGDRPQLGTHAAGDAITQDTRRDTNIPLIAVTLGALLVVGFVVFMRTRRRNPGTHRS
jgi:hypothetical protein